MKIIIDLTPWLYFFFPLPSPPPVWHGGKKKLLHFFLFFLTIPFTAAVLPDGGLCHHSLGSVPDSLSLRTVRLASLDSHIICRWYYASTHTTCHMRTIVTICVKTSPLWKRILLASHPLDSSFMSDVTLLPIKTTLNVTVWQHRF